MLRPQIADEYDANILILCEPYRMRPSQTWITNATETVAIWVRGAARARLADRGIREDYV